jgi:hypothetical protein
MIKNALLEEQGQGLQESQRMNQAADIVNKLQTDYPILKDNKQVESLVSRAIRGAKIERLEQARAEKKEYVDLSYEDYVEIINSILQNQPKSTTTTTEDKVEKMGGQPTMMTTPGIKDEMQDIISGMQAVGNTKKLF